MKKNIGTADRTIRILAALALAALLLTGQITGVVGIVLGVLAVALLGTSVVSFCPLYSLLKISTRKDVSPEMK